MAIDLLLEGGATRFDGNTWSVTHPAVAIFDGVFVAENVHSGEVVEIDHKRNLYRVIIGDDGVRLAEEDSDLAASSRAKTGEITAAAKAIQSHVPTGMKLEAFLALPVVADIDDQIAIQERIVDANRQAAAIRDRAALSEIPAPALSTGLANVLARTIDDIAQEAEQLVTSHLTAHGMVDGGGNWLAEGLDHADQGTCPFCGQDIEGLPLVAAYRAVFSDRYKALAADIAAMKAEIAKMFGEASLGRLATLAEQNKAAAEFWGRYCVFDSSPLAFPSDLGDALRALGDAAIALLEKKAGAPLEPVVIGDPFTTARERYETIVATTARVNEAIRTVNVMIAAKKAETGAADTKAAEAELARRKAIKTRHAEPVAALAASHASLVAEKNDIDKRKDAVRAKLDKHTSDVVKPYERRINDLLVAFNAGFSIAETGHGYPGGIATSSYQLVINNTAIDLGDGKTPTDRPSFKNTLSAGDRTTLALAFFLAHLERDADIARKIVVFDDPFSSQDAFRRRQTVHEIIKVGRKCAQVIVLSHDATFLKQVWDKTPVADRVALTIADHRAQGSKIMPVDLEKACQGRTATDIDDLQTYLATGAGTLLDIIRKMRVVLETHCRTTYPASFVAEDWLGDIVRKTREGGDTHPATPLYDELDQINDYTKQYHHGEDMADATPDQIDPPELSGYTKRTLKIVNALQA
jgi:wobble nucleotide-excising tRNase